MMRLVHRMKHKIYKLNQKQWRHSHKITQTFWKYSVWFWFLFGKINIVLWHINSFIVVSSFEIFWRRCQCVHPLLLINLVEKKIKQLNYVGVNFSLYMKNYPIVFYEFSKIFLSMNVYSFWQRIIFYIIVNSASLLFLGCHAISIFRFCSFAYIL